MGGVVHYHFVFDYFGEGGGKDNFLAHKGGGVVGNGDTRADALFVRFFHFQHKEPARPFGISRQCKSGIDMMHRAALKLRFIGVCYFVTVFLGISCVEWVNHNF